MVNQIENEIESTSKNQIRRLEQERNTLSDFQLNDSIDEPSHQSSRIDETTCLLNDFNNSIPNWPRNRVFGWLMPYGLKYPPPTLPESLRGLQADLDSAWMELERQHVIVNRVNLLTTTLTFLITSSGGLTTAMAGSQRGKIWSTVMGTLTTIAGTVMGGIRASGQPGRAENRVRRLDRIVEHIGRLYYSDGHPQQADKVVEETWRMIDEEEAQAEQEERKSSPGFLLGASSSSTELQLSGAVGVSNDPTGLRPSVLRSDSLLGKNRVARIMISNRP